MVARQVLLGLAIVGAGGLGVAAAMNSKALRGRPPETRPDERIAALRTRLEQLERRRAPEPMAVEAGSAALRSRLEALERRVEQLAAALEQRVAARPGRAQSGDEPARAVDAAVDDGRLTAASAAGAVAPPQLIEQAVRQVLEQQRRQEEEERQARAELRRVQRAERMVEVIAERLQLTDEQRDAFVSLIVERDEAQRTLWRRVRDGEVPFDEARAQSELLWSQYDEKVRTVLAPAQYAELEKIRAEREQEGGGPGRGRGPRMMQ